MRKKKYVGTSLALGEEIEPLTDNQDKVFGDWHNQNNIIMTGYAGTGKTFLAVYLALKELENKDSPIRKIIIIRSAVPTRKIGFLPGDVNEKGEVFEEPYEIMINDLYKRGDAYEILKKTGLVEFRTTSFLRGLTYDQSIIVVDEIQNMTDGELNTILTRFGDDTRFILCGDIRQLDLNSRNEKSGLIDIINILKRIRGVKITDFQIEDIVRSGFVHDYIVERENYFHDQNK